MSSFNRDQTQERSAKKMGEKMLFWLLWHNNEEFTVNCELVDFDLFTWITLARSWHARLLDEFSLFSSPLTRMSHLILCSPSRRESGSDKRETLTKQNKQSMRNKSFSVRCLNCAAPFLIDTHGTSLSRKGGKTRDEKRGEKNLTNDFWRTLLTQRRVFR
jgi:hypothetical protein